MRDLNQTWNISLRTYECIYTSTSMEDTFFSLAWQIMCLESNLVLENQTFTE